VLRFFSVPDDHAKSDGGHVCISTGINDPPSMTIFGLPQRFDPSNSEMIRASMQYTKEHSEILSYVPTPFEEIGGSAMVRKDSGIKNCSDLCGKPVCVSQGSNYTKPLVEQYGRPGKGFKGMPEALLALRDGNCVASVHATLGIQARLRNDAVQWRDYESPMPEQLISYSPPCRMNL